TFIQVDPYFPDPDEQATRSATSAGDKMYSEFLGEGFDSDIPDPKIAAHMAAWKPKSAAHGPRRSQGDALRVPGHSCGHCASVEVTVGESFFRLRAEEWLKNAKVPDDRQTRTNIVAAAVVCGRTGAVQLGLSLDTYHAAWCYFLHAAWYLVHNGKYPG